MNIQDSHTLEALVIVFIVLVLTAIWLAWLSKKKRVLAQLARLEDLAGGEYLNRSKAQEFFSGYSIQEPTGVYTSGISAKNINAINKINENFIEKRLSESKNFFDELELTNTQRLAVVRDEDANLINAGAGSGKTRTILSKVRYLVLHKLAKPDEILIVAYNRKIKDEIDTKIKDIAPGVTVSTFHAFGKKIIEQAEDERVSISELATDNKNLEKFLVQKMKGLLKIQTLPDLLINFFSVWRFEGNPEQGIKNKDEYFRKIQYVGLRSLDGRKLKSHQEVQIANWLILNGVEWEYEKDYPHNDTKRQHKPDFYLPDYELWIEHFGIDEDGNTAPWIDKERYSAEIKWKRAIHEKNKTRLVETYSHEAKKEGGIPRSLEKKLARCGVVRTPLSDECVDRLVKESFKPASPFIKLISQFLSLSRENQFSEKNLKERALSGRDLAFLALFNFFRRSYEQRLEVENEIDFADMIQRGMQHIKKGNYQSKFKYILVDEYQDITGMRLNFLLRLRKQVKDARLFCVGDDWQSIYQFQGANLDLITSFKKYVGPMQRTDLDKTFRYSQKISDFSRIWITQNPAQLEKNINASTASKEESRPIRIFYHDPKKQHDVLKEIVDLIVRTSQVNEMKCFVLGRYNFSKPDSWIEIQNYAKFKGLDIEFSTIHQSKGRESDWVVIVENKTDPDGFGFPSGIQDDPVLRMVLMQEGEFPNAEERRLFYVAITRARKGVFLLVPTGESSEFIHEIDPREKTGSEYESFVVTNQSDASKILFCPECGGKTIRKIVTDEGGFFYGCSYYPLCKGKLLTCENENCGSAIDLNGLGVKENYRCECGEEVKICPWCWHGVLKQWKSKYGMFWGCSQFSISGCKYKENISPKNKVREIIG